MIEVDSGILFYAFRYALGSMTVAVSTVVKDLKANWNNFDDSTQSLIKLEIREAIISNNAGIDMDVEQWRKILDL